MRLHASSNWLALSLCCLTTTLSAAAEQILAENGKTEYVIVKPTTPLPVEETTVADLAALLRQATGADFSIVEPTQAGQHSKRIFVGYSEPMRAVAGELEELANEERVYRTVGDDILIYGGGACGTVFAVYQFLEDQLHCRWFHPWGDSRIPKYERLALASCNRRMMPSYLIRDMKKYSWDRTGCPTSDDFFRRQRVHNNTTIAPTDTTLVPLRQVGRHIHTLPALVPSGIPNLPQRCGPHPLFKDKKYFETNPEYFTLNSKGKRTYLGHYCFSNAGLRQTLIENMEKLVAAGRATDTPAVIDVDQADTGGRFCYCEHCQALEKKYQSPGGAMFDCLLEISAHFQKKYPRIVIRFLAYNRQQTELPPAAEAIPGGRLPENLVPYFAPITGDFSKAWDAPSNQVIYDSLASWGRVSSRIWLYYYPSTFPRPLIHYPLFGNILKCAHDYRIGHAHNIRYVFNDEAYPWENMGFVSLQLYLRTMLANDVTLDIETMVDEYFTAIYGPAAKPMRAYFDELEQLMAADDGYLRWNPDPRFINYLTVDNLLRWQRDFDAMEALAAKDARALMHVRTTRMNLDLNTMHLAPKIKREQPDHALDFDQIYARYLAGIETVMANSHNIAPGSKKPWQYEKMLAAGDHVYAVTKEPKPLPKAFAKVPPDSIRQVTPACNKTRVPPDPQAAFGIALAADAPHLGAAQYRFNDSMGQLPALQLDVPVQPGREYQLYYLGRTALSRECDVRVPAAGSGGTYGTAFIGHCWEKNEPEQLWDLYVSCRFDDAKVYTDRIVLVKTDGRTPPIQAAATTLTQRPSTIMIAPVIASADGDPTAVDWNAVMPMAAWGESFSGNTPKTPETEMRVAFDDEYLYLAYREQRASGTEAAPFWNNTVDMFFAGDTLASVLQVGVAPSGRVRCNLYTLTKTSDPNSNEDIRVSNAAPFEGKINNQSEDGVWQWQMALPRHWLPQFTTVMQANFFRNHGEAKLSLSWNPIYTRGYLNGFHRLGRIYPGRLELSGRDVTSTRRVCNLPVMDGNHAWDIKASVPSGLDLRPAYRIAARLCSNATLKDEKATSRIGVYDPATKKVIGNRVFPIRSIIGEDFKTVTISKGVTLTETSFLYVGGFLPEQQAQGDVFLEAFVLEPMPWTMANGNKQ